jgi:hypothetical protein
MPVVGFLNHGSPEANAHLVAAFRKGMSEAGFIEGQNVVITSAGRATRSSACQSWRQTWYGHGRLADRASAMRAGETLRFGSSN